VCPDRKENRETSSPKALAGKRARVRPQDGVDRRGIDRLVVAQEFVLHTGHISHLSKPDECDTVEPMLGDANPTAIFYVPGRHDVPDDDGKPALG
jgi:hypothetical protein